MRRTMHSRKPNYSWKLSWIVIVTILPNHVELGPTKHRILREIYPEIEPEIDQQVCVVGDVVYAANDVIPAEQSCLKCKCHPPKVECETIICAKKPGCKAVHQPNKCCPDYQCECQHQGKIYANGEKVSSSGENCQVCYCRGGEIKCTDVTCYTRTDCAAKTVPGQCCPKYDNCPEIVPGRTTQGTSTELLELWPINSSSPPHQEESRITIHEIIPEIKEIPITKVNDANFNDLVVTDSEPEESEVLEVFQPPPVLRIGDKLLFLHESEFVIDNDTTTPLSVITVIGAEGLERGFEDSGEETPEHSLFNNSNDLEPKASESTHILSLVKKKKKPETSTTPEATTTEIPTSTAEIQESTTMVTSTEEYPTTTLEMTTTENLHSKESLEETSEDSGEAMTESLESTASTENASVEFSENTEIDDMVQSTPRGRLRMDDVEILQNVTEHKNYTAIVNKDVEMIDELPQKIIGKRENSLQDETDEIFKQLEAELNVDATERTQSEAEEKAEAEKIFKELLDETSTPQTLKKGDKNAEMINTITDAIARLTLRNTKGPPDLNLIGLITNFFGSPKKK